jgi:very-short-patch-repair endonuclease
LEPRATRSRLIAVVPFVGTEALAAGFVTHYGLRTRHDAVHRNVYVPRGHTLSPVDKAVAAWLWSRREATLAGLSAAAMHGSKWIDARLPAELNRRSRDKTDGIVLHSDELSSDEITTVRGIPTTTPGRTAFDLGRRYGLTLAVIRLDALMQASGMKTSDILIERHRGARGLAQLRKAVALADAGAESPQETRTRLVLTAAGLRPRTQIDVYDRFGDHVGRIDMGWNQWKVGVEYDGEQHWTDPARRTRDIDRLAELEALGWRIIRVSAEMLRCRPHTIVERTRAALHAAGWSSVDLLT